MNDQAGNEELTRLAARVTELEVLLTHMQRTLHDLDAVALDQQRQLDKLAQQLARMTLDMNTLQTGSGGEVRSPEDEKPPHY